MPVCWRFRAMRAGKNRGRATGRKDEQMRDKLNDAVETARPYVERIAKDDDLHDHVKSAYESARRIYDELLGDRGTTGTALRFARDKELQDELRKTIDELRAAGKRVQKGGESHAGRNVTLLLVGIALGVLVNPL